MPPWRPGLEASALPESYRDLLEVAEDAGGPLRAGQIAAAAGLSTDKAKVEGLRAKLKRLVERGWLAEEAGPGLFGLPARTATVPGKRQNRGDSGLFFLAVCPRWGRRASAKFGCWCGGRVAGVAAAWWCRRWFALTRACELAGPGRVGAGCPSEPGFNLAFESVS